MQPIHTILGESRLVSETTNDPNVAALAGLVAELAVRVLEVEGTAATNELQMSQLATKQPVGDANPSPSKHGPLATIG